ncbi:leucine-rich repeat domain-containing protein [Domibacillus sp. PGB-M46]|uniref:leucine-rich repeat domain-containing protein n=1 Tax=Domibacillus sp. PGB-M46 TaxID=2910255 RepID=UPI001F57BE83|nr:leucine-rich repeat domain-containing protein [Domibacillus sp. PGB-M46]MCI2253888.1 leucine-rich repeat domain-containing protein [Domibacillus sp. PGB-M46]
MDRLFKGLNVFMILLLIGSLFPQFVAANERETPSADIQAEAVVIEDPYLEWIIRAQLNKPSDPLTVEDLESLTGISAQDTSISSLKGLEPAVNLEILHLGGNDITDLTPIRNFQKLKALTINGNKVEDLQALENLNALEYLDLSGNQISDISILHNKTSLKELSLNDNTISDISALRALTNLEKLSLDKNNIDSIQALGELTKINELSVFANPINIFTDQASANVAAALIERKAIVMGNDETPVNIPDANLESAIRAEIEKTDGPLNKGDLSKLSTLVAVKQGIRDLTGLEQAVNLRSLNVDQNQIESLIPIKTLTALEELELLGNNLTDLSPISEMTDLIKLDLGSNKITDLRPLENLKKVTELTISSNDITNLNGISNLTELEWLDLEANKVKDLSPLQNMESLSMLDISQNEISSMTEIKNLPISEKSVEFAENPVSQFASLPGSEEAVTVDRRKEWTITFNQAVDPESIQRNSVYVMEGNVRIENDLVPAVDGKSVKILPVEGGYAPGQEYTIYITKSVKTKNGKNLKQPIIKKFQIAPEETRGSQNFIADPAISERKLLKFADLVYLDFHKVDHNQPTIYKAMGREHLEGNIEYPISTTLQKKWENYSDKTRENLIEHDRNTSEQDRFYITGIDSTVSLNEIYFWKVLDTRKGKSGFYAAAFQSPDNSKIVIAYRGSISVAKPLRDPGDWFGDWIKTNGWANWGHENSKQITQAIEFYQEIEEEYSQDSQPDIFLTGHSLGGWLAQRVAAEQLEISEDNQFKKAVTFNAPGFEKPEDEVDNNYLKPEQWKNKGKQSYREKIDNIWINYDFTGGWREHLGTDILFPIDHIKKPLGEPDSWLDERVHWHGIGHFYSPRAYLSLAEMNEIDYNESAIIRDLWKSDFDVWYRPNQNPEDSLFMELPFTYNVPLDIFLAKKPGELDGRKGYKFKLPNEVTSFDKLIISPIKPETMEDSLNIRIEDKDGNMIIQPHDFTTEDEKMELDISNLKPDETYFLFINGSSGDAYKLKIGSEGLGKITGKITNALTGRGQEDLTLTFRNGTKDRPGEVVGSSSTDSSGNYSMDLPGGNYVLEIAGEGFFTETINVVSLGNGQIKENQNASVSPVLPDGEVRIVLEWGESPSDLDSHLTGPIPNSAERFHVYYSNKQQQLSGATLAELDVDDLDSYGPETTTIYNQTSGTYRYSVHDYTNKSNTRESTGLSSSRAKVRVIFSDGRVETFSVPQNTPGTLWTVFELNGNRINPINRLSFGESTSSIQEEGQQKSRSEESIIINDVNKKPKE